MPSDAPKENAGRFIERGRHFMSDSYISRLIDSFETRASNVAMRVVGNESEVYTFAESLAAIRSIAYRLS